MGNSKSRKAVEEREKLYERLAVDESGLNDTKPMQLQTVLHPSGTTLRYVDISRRKVGKKKVVKSPPMRCLNGFAKPITLRDFEVIKVIGTGYMGTVSLVRRKCNNALFAMKVIPKKRVQEHQLVEKTLSERDVLGGTVHEFLGGELSYHLNNLAKFSEDTARFYAAELVLALEHLHRRGIIFRDLKPENILLSAEGHVKLVDFGLAKFGIVESCCGTKTLCGSMEYLAPEVWGARNTQKGYGTAVDWWSFGVVLYEMLTGLPPWYSTVAATMRDNINTQPLEFPSEVGEDARDLITRLLTRNPNERLGSRRGSSEIKHHVFFADISDWDNIGINNDDVKPPINPCPTQENIEVASNFDFDFTRMSVGSLDSSVCSSHDDFSGFSYQSQDFQPTINAPTISATTKTA